jgi:WD40 repeat protein
MIQHCRADSTSLVVGALLLIASLTVQLFTTCALADDGQFGNGTGPFGPFVVNWKGFVKGTILAEEVEVGSEGENQAVLPDGYLVRQLGFSDDGMQLNVVQSGSFGIANQWDLSKGRLSSTSLLPTGDCCVSPDLKWYLMFSYKRRRMELRETQSGRICWSGVKAKYGGAGMGWSFSPDGSQVLFLMSEKDTTTRREDDDTRTNTMYCCLARDGTVLWKRQLSRETWQPHFNGNGRFIVCLGGATKPPNVLVLDARTGKKLRTFGDYATTPTAVAANADGSCLLIGFAPNTVVTAKTSRDGKSVLRLRTIRTHIYEPGALGVVPHSDTLFVGGISREGTERRARSGWLSLSDDLSPNPKPAWWYTPGLAGLWDAMTGNRLHALEGHRSPVSMVAFSRDGKRIATGTAAGSVHIWDRTTGRQLVEIMSLPKGGDWVAVTPKGEYDGSDVGCRFLKEWYGDDAGGQRRQATVRSPGLLRKAIAGR